MQAVAITAYGHAPSLIEMPRPAVQPGRSLVRVEAAPINPLDLLCASGTSYFGQHPLPYIPGVEGVGIVEEGVSVPSGTRVWFCSDAGMKAVNGSMAEYCLVDDTMMTPLGEDLASLDAAALGLPAVAAFLSLTKAGRLQGGEQVLILGAGGAVGRLAMQFARLLGARRVIAAGRTPAARNRALQLGAAETVSLASNHHQALTEALRNSLDGNLDLVIDTLAGAPAAAAIAVLGQRGRLVNFGSSAGPDLIVPSAILRSREISIVGYTNAGAPFAEKATAFHHVAEWMAAGKVQLDHHAVPFQQAARAWAEQQSGTGRKLVLIPATAS
jgi:NADPH:quinone reductase-like Zn-dependent oxidoreductase